MVTTRLLGVRIRLTVAAPLIAALGCTPLARGLPDAAADAARTDAAVDALTLDRPDITVTDVPATDVTDVPRADVVDASAMDVPDAAARDVVDVPAVDVPVVDIPTVDRPDVAAPDIVDVPGVDIVDVPSCTTTAARLLRPPSGARVTGRQVTFRWVLPPVADGARVELCSNRSCGTVTSTVSATGSSHTMLVPGRTWWRVQPTRGGVPCGAVSAVWSLIPDANTGPGQPYRVLTDLNGDLLTDAFVSGQSANSGSGQLYIYTGVNQMGIMPMPSQTLTSPVGGNGQYGGPVAGDFNGDGLTDVAVSQVNPSGQYLGQVWAYLSNGAQIGTTPQALIPPTPVYSHFGTFMFSGDFNGDGYADLAVASGMLNAGSNDVDDPQGGRVSIYRGSSTGLSATAFETLVSTGGAGAQFGNSGTVVDLDNDGYDDLLLNTFVGTARAWVHFRGGPSGMQRASSMITSMAGVSFDNSTPSNLGDVTGDGRVDVGAIVGGSSWRVLVGSGAAGTLGSTGFVVTLDANPTSAQRLGSADIDRDGVSDLILAQTQGGATRIHVYRSTGAGATALTQISALTNQPEFDGPFLVGDFNGDGIFDVLAGHPTYNGNQGAISLIPGVLGGFTSMPMGRALLPPSNDALMGFRLASLLRPRRSREL